MPPNQNNNHGITSESEETEHLPLINNPSSELTTSNNDNNIMGIDNNNNNSETVTDNIGINQQKHPSIPSMNSAARGINTNTNNINSRTCNVNNTVKSQHHAYFASSEEESEAELDETLSHCSSRASNQVVLSQQHNQDDHDHIMKSSLRGSKKLEDIASKAFRASRVRMTIPEPADHDYKGKKGIDNLDSSKPKAAYSSSQMKQPAVPPPPQTVTVAVTGKKSDTQQHKQLSSPSILLSNNHPRSSTIQQQQQPQVAIGSSPIRKRIRKKKKKKQKQQLHSQKHLPRGLPVFKDPRSCMWTSTHDANAPSEDRYSSLVNVLLRPPKTRRSKKVDNTLGEGIGKVDNGGTKDHSGSSEEEGSAAMSEEDNTQFQDNVTQSTPAVTTSTNTLPSNMNGNNNNNTNRKDINNDNVAEDDEDNTSLVRLSLWSVIDGHGGGCVATYAAEVLLPHIAASVARALNSEIIDRGVCNVNGQLRDANALDLDGLIRSSDRSRHSKNQVRQREAGIDVVNPNSIHYRSPWEDSESEEDVGVGHLRRNIDDEEETTSNDHHPDDGMRLESESEAESEAPVSMASSLLPGNRMNGESVSSVKTSVKTAVSPVTHQFPVGTHSPAEVASITRAITDSFLAVDEGWINSIDPITTHQTSCVSNGRWNAGACALVVFIVQRLDWCRSSRVDHETHHRERGGTGGFEDTAHNTDAARRRKLDYAAKSKSISSLSTLSSTSSITTEANTKDEIGEESEITETEDDEDDVSDMFGPRRRRKKIHHHHHNHHSHLDDPHHQDGVFIGHHEDGHYYRPHDAMLYTAHVGDCRAVMLGSAPPRTIKVPPEQGDGSRLSLDHSEDDSSSESIADEISSSEHDSDSSGDLMEDDLHGPLGSAKRGSGRAMGYGVRRSKRQRRSEKAVIQPFVPLPPLRRESDSEESTIASDNLSEEEKFFETEDEGTLRSVRSGSPTQMDRPPSPTQLVADPVHPPPLPLSMQMRPIDLTTDHSAYNPSEVTAVLRRSNNAPKAISSASSGGIKRVAGSLAVTRALGDAYLKTPRLSFFPYKRHAPYITGRPEVNCRVLTKGADRIVLLASDGVWERASGEDVLRWVRNYYNLRIAGVEEDQHLQQQHDVYNDNDNNSLSMSRKSRPTFANDEEDVLGSDGNETVAAIASVGSSEDISSEDDVEKIPASSIAKKPLEHNGDVLAKPPQEAHDAVGEVAVDSDAATTATSTTAVITTSTAAKAGSKRKHPATADESASSRSASTASFALGTARTSSRRHLRSSSRCHSATVSEVIVRKVLNKVRKTRNISSLRMLMSLPKGRARRSKHDDITATVIDLSGFVS